MTIATELQSLSPSAKLEFFVVDPSVLGGSILYFHNGTNELREPVIWQGQTYQYIPIEAKGFEVRADGPRPRPTLRVGDVFGLLGALARQYRNLAGATLIRKRTHARYLDAANFADGNAHADPDADYPDELWTFDRISARTSQLVEWELTSPLDLEGLMLPGRQVRNTVCTAAYRDGDNCPYDGPAVAKADDTPTSNAALDKCSLLISGCKLRFGANAVLPINIFPGAGTISQG